MQDLQDEEFSSVLRRIDRYRENANDGTPGSWVTIGLANVERNLIVERQRESVEYRRRTNESWRTPQLEKFKSTTYKVETRRKFITKHRLTGVSLSAVQRACKEEQAVG